MSRANVMIVDDDRDLAESLAELLEMSGCSVTTAANGKEAVLGHGKQDFDVTFMDVRMPIMNGIDSFLAIRALRPQARVVMMTGFREPHMRVALDAGAEGPVEKPFAIEDMLAFVDRPA
jgi:two-component system, NtrC family, response regulator HydG